MTNRAQRRNRESARGFVCPTDGRKHALGLYLRGVENTTLLNQESDCHCGKRHQLDVRIRNGVARVTVTGTAERPVQADPPPPRERFVPTIVRRTDEGTDWGIVKLVRRPDGITEATLPAIEDCPLVTGKDDTEAIANLCAEATRLLNERGVPVHDRFEVER